MTAKKVIKLQAEWCGPCKALGQWMEGVDIPYEVESVDIDDNPDAAPKYGIRGIPAVVLVDEDGNKLDYAVGFEPSQKFLKDLV